MGPLVCAIALALVCRRGIRFRQRPPLALAYRTGLFGLCRGKPLRLEPDEPKRWGALDASFQLFVFLVMGAVFLALDRTVCGQADGVFSAQAVGGDSASTVQRLTTRRRG